MKFLVEASYTAEGALGVLKSGGGVNRKNATEKMSNSLGGTLEAYYYVNNCDAYVICELPSMAAAAAIALTIKSTGLGSVKTQILLEPEEVDAAAALSVEYRSPGN
jgi:uncharacterized protein with GYD domain